MELAGPEERQLSFNSDGGLGGESRHQSASALRSAQADDETTERDVS